MDRKQERNITLILAIMQFSHIVDFVMMMPLGPRFMRVFSITPSQFSVLISAYTLSAGITGILAALVVDRFDRKHAALTMYLGFALGTLLCALAPDYHTLLIARFIAGGFGGIMGALILSIIGDVFPPERRGTATGIVMSAFSIASVVGIPIGLALASMVSWHTPFLIISGISFFFFIVGIKVLPPIRSHMETGTSQGSPLSRLGAVLLTPHHWNAFLFVFSIMVAGFSLIPFLSPYMVQNVGLTEKQLPLIYFVGGIFTFFTSRLIGRYADHYGKTTVFRIVATLSLLPILLVTNLPEVKLYLAIASTTIFMILISGRVVPALAMVTGSMEPSLRGSFMSINTSIQQLSAALASYMGGLIVVEEQAGGRLLHYELVGYLSILFTFAAILLAGRLREHRKSA